MEPLTLFGLGTNIMFSLGIVFAIVFIIFYMRQRFSDYNHKLNSMFQLISAMADELNSLKNKLPNDNNTKIINSEDTQENELMKLVVSDDESEDESESDDDSEECDSDDEDETINNIDYNNVIVNNLDNVIELTTGNTLDLTNGNTLSINNELEQVILEEVSHDIATGNNTKEDVKLIELSYDVKDNTELDINKMNVKQLKDLVTHRGIVFEQSAKKKDLIKLLEDNSN